MIPIKYLNNRGAAVDLNANGVMASTTNMVAWKLDVNDTAGRITSLATDVVTSKVPAATYTRLARRRLYEIPAYDIADMKPWRLYIGDWYVRCYMTASSQERWWAQDGGTKYDLEFTSDDPVWRRETEYSYTERHDGGQGLDYEHDYQFDYGYSSSAVNLVNENYLPADLIIRVYGPITNPRVTIAGNVYGADVSLEQGDRLEIDTLEKTVTIVRLDGDRENGFPDIYGEYSEGSGSYVFEKLPTGESDATWDGSFDFDVVVVERRYEPRLV